ncbi:MAG: hypothetical protein BWY69_00255 [Planctomycetes bacterium ADurb.Bin401]|nr:MAG: hypothetical protein BWY69_00255 [Planctomycetes bacterium ADurb.Bin401]
MEVKCEVCGGQMHKMTDRENDHMVYCEKCQIYKIIKEKDETVSE